MTQFKHPKGLYVLFLTEMWERFSFYGLRALLVLYLTQAVSWSDVDAYSLFGAYAALVYATPVLGGLIADKFLGFKKAVFLGGVLIMLGHFSLAVPGDALFYPGLAFIVCGTGYLKSCISSMVGELYEQGDPRRDSGFTIFYMGINLGALAAGICVGIVAQVFGWHYGFGLAGIGMLFGLLTLVYGKRYLVGVGDSPDPNRLQKKTLLVSNEKLIWLLSLLAVPGVAMLLHMTAVVGWLLLAFIGASLVAVVMLAIKVNQKIRRRLITLMILVVFAIGFFSLFEQAASSITLFTERGVDRFLFGWQIPTPVFQSLNPLFILVFAPVMAVLWVKLAERNKEPSTPMKFFWGLLLVTLGFGALAFGAYQAIGSGLANMWWLVLAYFLHTIGELCLSPVGLSAVTKLAPKGYVGMMMGIWFLAMSTSNYLAALLARISAVNSHDYSLEHVYASAFHMVTNIGFVITALMLVMVLVIKKY